ncbi:MAG: flagellar M-ring protein FliF [Hyphomicrobiaceae bacterium]|nr:flagellar M-ring protein FliF [Hyphomicrobiaceae bacterium]
MTDFLQKLGPARLGAMAVVAALLVGFFTFIIMRVSTPNMVPLYTNLSMDDSAQIVEQLEAADVPYELRANGGTIMVPDDTVLRTRMRLAQEGLPSGGSIGYEIFDRSDTLGATSFVQNINHVRALEGELARTIRSIDRVQNVRVHLVLPERQLFSRDEASPTASIVVRTRGDLDTAQIRAIQHLVASAVEGLRPSAVSIVDEAGRLLATGAEEDETAFFTASLEERRTAIESRLRHQIETILQEIVGPDRARVQVSTELDFNRVSQTSDIFDPEGQVVRSTQTREENGQTTEVVNGEVTVANEIPGGTAGEGGDNGLREARTQSEEVVNYEISRTTRTEVLEAGRIKRMSVAVLVDGLYERDGDGNLVYTPRDQAQLDMIAALVRSAVGFDQARGDVVEVVNLPFAEGPREELVEDTGLFVLTKEDYFAIAELATIALLTLIVLFFVVRPLLKRIVAPEDNIFASLPVGGEAAPGMVIGPNGEVVASPTPNVPVGALENTTAKAIEHAAALGALQAESLARVGELVTEHPNEAMQVIRSWLTEANAA